MARHRGVAMAQANFSGENPGAPELSGSVDDVGSLRHAVIGACKIKMSVTTMATLKKLKEDEGALNGV